MTHTTINILIEKPDGSIMEWMSEVPTSSMDVEYHYRQGGVRQDGPVFSTMPDVLTGFTVGFRPGCHPAPDHTFYTVTQRYADDATHRIIARLHADCAALRAENRSLRDSIDKLTGGDDDWPT